MGEAWSPPFWTPPGSSLHCKEEFVQLFSYWLYNYICAKGVWEYSNFLIIFAFRGSWCVGKGSMDFKVVFCWGLLVRLTFCPLWKWVICYSSLPCASFPECSFLHTCRSLFFHFCIIPSLIAFMKKGAVLSNSHPDNFDTNRSVMFC